MLKYEIIKQLRTPFVWLFAAACVIINSLVIISQDYEIRIVMNECRIAGIIGTVDITNADISVIEDDFLRDYASELTFKHSGFISEEQADDVLSFLINTHPVKMPDNLNSFIFDIAQQPFRQRIAEINQNGEYCFLNGGKTLHDMMYWNLLLICTGESMLFALVISSKCGAHEYLEGTTQVVYSAKKGRSLAQTKLFAALALTELLFAFVTVISAAVFLIRCPCFVLLDSTLVLDEETSIIYPWNTVTVAGYFGLNVLISACISGIFTLIGYTFFGLFIKWRGNFIFGLTGALIFTVLMYAVWSLPREFHGFVTVSNPVMLLLDRIGQWFAASVRGTCIPYFEVYAVVGWGALFAVLGALVIRRIKKVNL